MNTSRSSSAAGAANTTVSSSFRSMTLHESIVVGDSRFHRLITPWRVPIASGGSVSPDSPSESGASPLRGGAVIAIAVTTYSPGTGSVFSVVPSSSLALTPPATLSVVEAGSAGRSATWASTRRPDDVIRPYEASVVVGNRATIWSPSARASPDERDSHTSNALGEVRAISPEAPIITTHGSSSNCSADTAPASSPAFLAAAAAAATSASAEDTVCAARTASIAPAGTPSAPAAVTGCIEPSGSTSSSTVRRGEPYRSATSSISETTTRSSSSAEARMRSSSSILRRRSSRSASSSMRLIRVRRRSRRSRMYWACTSSRSNTAISRLLAASASSEERITWMTSSMSTIASSSPSTRCSRSCAFVRRNSLRRRTTRRRWSIHTCSISFKPIVCGRPSTSATLFIVKLSCSGVCLNSCTSTAFGSNPVLISMTMRVPLCRSVRSIAPEMPSSLRFLTPSEMRSSTRSGPTMNGSSVTTIAFLRAVTFSICVAERVVSVPRPDA